VADITTNKVLFNGTSKLITQHTFRYVDTGESNVLKVDKSAYVGPNGLEPSQLIIEMIEGDTSGITVTLTSDHDTDVVLATFGGMGRFKQDYRHVGGLPTSGTGGAGDILASVVNGAAGDSYNIVIHFRKKN
jgi:hypothetical protein